MLEEARAVFVLLPLTIFVAGMFYLARFEDKGGKISRREGSLLYVLGIIGLVCQSTSAFGCDIINEPVKTFSLLAVIIMLMALVAGFAKACQMAKIEPYDFL